MKNSAWVAVVVGLLATVMSAAPANAQCTPSPNYPGVMIKFDGDAWAYETAYTASTLASALGSQLTVVGRVSVFCSPFTDLDPTDANTDYTFIWDGLTSQGTITTLYLGGSFRIYAGSPRNAPTLSPPALPAPGVVPDAFVDGTMILSGTMDSLSVLVSRSSQGIYTHSFRANYVGAGGTLFDRIGDAKNLISGFWCPAPPNPNPPYPSGTCPLPAGWSAHPNGKWDTPSTVPALPSTWGKIKTLYR
jgi:hypothetical protein